MNRLKHFASRATVASALIVASPLSMAFGQQHPSSIGDYYGAGPEGTIGRGTDRLPGGPSDWGGNGRIFGYQSPYPGDWSGRTYTYSRGYSTIPRPSVVQPETRPYLTNQYYQPGNGHRYPLYYNPITRTYFYYPTAR